jgi:hypothetical protein
MCPLEAPEKTRRGAHWARRAAVGCGGLCSCGRSHRSSRPGGRGAGPTSSRSVFSTPRASSSRKRRPRWPVFSANFTCSGWGFPGGAPPGDRACAWWRSFLHQRVSPFLFWGRSVGPQVLLPEAGGADVRWPSFLREARLIPICLSPTRIGSSARSGALPRAGHGILREPSRARWAGACEWRPGGSTLPPFSEVVLAPDVLESLLKDKELHVTRLGRGCRRAFERSELSVPLGFEAARALARRQLQVVAGAHGAATNSELEPLIGQVMRELDPQSASSFAKPSGCTRATVTSPRNSAGWSSVIAARRSTGSSAWARSSSRRRGPSLPARTDTSSTPHRGSTSAAASCPTLLLMRCVTEMHRQQGMVRKSSLGTALTGCYSTLLESPPRVEACLMGPHPWGRPISSC